MFPVDFERSLWFQKNRMHVVAPEKASTCRSKGTKVERMEKVLRLRHCVSQPQEEKSLVKVVEDFESRLHKAVSSVVERDKERKSRNE